MEKTADDTAALFDLKPHPFDGWFAPILTDKPGPARFHYLAKASEYAAWHRSSGPILLTHIDGAPLTLTTSEDGLRAQNRLLKPGASSSGTIGGHVWRTWETLGHWSLIIVSTEKAEFFLGWELAPDDWYPG
ncbi:cupin domain-containing protein [Parvularcula sp. IMCC14364]|uniref:cupin domain-containing protein n=1 Tax=Parvularcula sp. IMCC14364 TaxID=3067902 RepID=UPI0027404B82|nr:cupin domain-containing protein [Parvularcula sp. IMCC14364]